MTFQLAAPLLDACVLAIVEESDTRRERLAFYKGWRCYNQWKRHGRTSYVYRFCKKNNLG